VRALSVSTLLGLLGGTLLLSTLTPSPLVEAQVEVEDVPTILPTAVSRDTATPTVTCTPTATSTDTPTSTFTPMDTATETATATETPTATQIPTDTEVDELVMDGDGSAGGGGGNTRRSGGGGSKSCPPGGDNDLDCMGPPTCGTMECNPNTGAWQCVSFGFTGAAADNGGAPNWDPSAWQAAADRQCRDTLLSESAYYDKSICNCKVATPTPVPTQEEEQEEQSDDSDEEEIHTCGACSPCQQATSWPTCCTNTCVGDQVCLGDQGCGCPECPTGLTAHNDGSSCSCTCDLDPNSCEGGVDNTTCSCVY